MLKMMAAFGLTVGMCAAGAVCAEPFTDWTTTKGAWEVTTIKVDPNHIDDYMTGLRKGWVFEQETLKAHGVIDQYMALVKLNSGAGANVQLIIHYPSLAMMEPDKARDQAIQKEIEAHMTKAASDAQVAGYDKYRTFVSDDVWTTVVFTK